MIEVLTGDAVEKLRELPAESIHCCVTSPPYWGLRDYGTAEWEGGDPVCDHIDWKQMRGSDPNHKQSTNNNGYGGVSFGKVCELCGAKRIDSQLGLERTPEEYVAKMVEVFREVKRVLRKDGTLWLNLGDSYASQGGPEPAQTVWQVEGASDGQNGGRSRVASAGLKPKDLIGIPWRVAFALQADGWWLRSDIIWAKPNPMPESVTDRCTKSHEYLFMLTKASSYYYDAEAIKENTSELTNWTYAQPDKAARAGQSTNGTGATSLREFQGSRNKRSVWTIATSPYPEAHFATYPPDLVKPCIMAGTSAKGCCAKCGARWERVVESTPMVIDRTDRMSEMGEFGRYQSSGTMLEPATSKTLGWRAICKCDAGVVPCTVLDCFAGSGTTGMVALELGRKAILIELNPAYVKLIEQRCTTTVGLALA